MKVLAEFATPDAALHALAAVKSLGYLDVATHAPLPLTTEEAHAGLAKAFGREVVPVKLVDPRFYHLDMSVCPLDDRRAIVSPDAWDEASRARLAELVEEPLVVSVEEAMTFCVNSVVIGKTIVMSDCPARVGRQLEAWGFDVVISPVGEFIKAGGGIRCMTLDLDLLGENS